MQLNHWVVNQKEKMRLYQVKVKLEIKKEVKREMQKEKQKMLVQVIKCK